MQDGLSGWAGQSGRHGDDLSAQRGAAGEGVALAGQGSGGVEQLVGDRGGEHPGGVRVEASGGQVRQRSVDQIGEHGFDDGADGGRRLRAAANRIANTAAVFKRRDNADARELRHAWSTSRLAAA